jgi:hypothetical protein
MKMQVIIGLIASTVVNIAFAEDEATNVCLYAGQPYTKGSVILMEGVKKVCRDESYRCMKEQESNPNHYIAPSTCISLAWKDLLPGQH